MNKQESTEIAKVLDKLRTMFDAETAQIQTARKAHIPALLDRRDNVQSMIRVLDALVSDNG